jgi:hypothetical protein
MPVEKLTHVLWKKLWKTFELIAAQKLKFVYLF